MNRGVRDAEPTLFLQRRQKEELTDGEDETGRGREFEGA
jgi:hypothetical protein